MLEASSTSSRLSSITAADVVLASPICSNMPRASAGDTQLRVVCKALLASCSLSIRACAHINLTGITDRMVAGITYFALLHRDIWAVRAKRRGSIRAWANLLLAHVVDDGVAAVDAGTASLRPGRWAVRPTVGSAKLADALSSLPTLNTIQVIPNTARQTLRLRVRRARHPSGCVSIRARALLQNTVAVLHGIPLVALPSNAFDIPRVGATIPHRRNTIGACADSQAPLLPLPQHRHPVQSAAPSSASRPTHQPGWSPPPAPPPSSPFPPPLAHSP
mmetsp:Transcript_38140/g.85426  ORF Transcript_38140/g.85426 Transcript_38140/m.85426 type:complete len:276 (-) Transcript_38140:9-836(-)